VLRRAHVLACAFIAGVVIVAASSAGGAPRLAGSYRTDFRITAETNITGIRTGQEAVKTWTFSPRCATGACTTMLVRPSIATGSTSTYSYTLRPVSATRYTGSITPVPVLCSFTTGKQVPGGYINHQTIVLNVTKASAGKVVAYSGTTHTVNTLTAAGRSSGCPATSVQSAAFHTAG
jgi:hypothetical protein